MFFLASLICVFIYSQQELERYRRRVGPDWGFISVPSVGLSGGIFQHSYFGFKGVRHSLV